MIISFIAYLLGAFSACVWFWLRAPQVILSATEKRPALVNYWRKNGDYILVFANGDLYRGEGTVWHRYPAGDRCDTQTESWLSDVVAELEWREGDLRA